MIKKNEDKKMEFVNKLRNLNNFDNKSDAELLQLLETTFKKN